MSQKSMWYKQHYLATAKVLQAITRRGKVHVSVQNDVVCVKMGNSLSFPSFGRNNVIPDNDSIEKSVQSIGRAATDAARVEANKWHR